MLALAPTPDACGFGLGFECTFGFGFGRGLALGAAGHGLRVELHVTPYRMPESKLSPRVIEVSSFPWSSAKKEDPAFGRMVSRIL